MNGVIIKDLQPDRRVLAVDLRHVLSAFGPRALASEWRVREVWAEDDAKPRLEAFDGSELVAGQHLAALAQDASQIIDGEFSALEPGRSAPWVVVEMVRTLSVPSTWFGSEFPIAVVTSELNQAGLTSLVRDEMFSDPAEWLTNSEDEAIALLKSKLQK